MTLDRETITAHSEEVSGIITAKPPWILRQRITLIFLVLLSIVLMSAFICYPDIIKTSLKLNSSNVPKEVVVHQQDEHLD